MIASLKAEARIAAGQYVGHDPDTFVDRLIEIRAAAISNVADAEIQEFGRYARQLP